MMGFYLQFGWDYWESLYDQIAVGDLEWFWVSLKWRRGNFLALAVLWIAF